MVKCLPEFEYFTVFLKNKNIIFKIRRSQVTDYAALKNRIFIFRPRYSLFYIFLLIIHYSLLKRPLFNNHYTPSRYLLSETFSIRRIHVEFKGCWGVINYLILFCKRTTQKLIRC